MSDYVDKLQATGSGIVQFRDEQGNQRMVCNTGERTEYRVIASSVSFAGFSENEPFSTQVRLMIRIVAYLMAEDETPPEAISGMTAQRTDDSIILSWDLVDEDAEGAHESLDHYLVERSHVPFGSAYPIAFVLDPTYEDSPWGFGNPDANYFYVIRAIDTAGNIGEGAMAAEIDYEIEDGE